MNELKLKTTIALLKFISFFWVVMVCSILNGQEPAIATIGKKPHVWAIDALDRILQQHSEDSQVLVAQGELDQLIDPTGGGACPLSTALIAVQAPRSMADLTIDPHPHRSALRMFQHKHGHLWRDVASGIEARRSSRTDRTEPGGIQ